MRATLKRTEFRDKQTLGILVVFDNDGNKVFECKTLELELDTNQTADDCIPYGDYEVKKRWSAKYKNHFHVLDVPNRSYILIHAGSYHRHTLGCILVGNGHIDIDADGYKDVVNSRVTMTKLNNILPKIFTLKITY